MSVSDSYVPSCYAPDLLSMMMGDVYLSSASTYLDDGKA